jgi:hypothetical protein
MEPPCLGARVAELVPVQWQGRDSRWFTGTAKDTKFTWRGLDLPQDSVPEGREYLPQTLDAKVLECVPERRIGWYSCGIITEHGHFYLSYHTWLITPMGPKKCYVTFEEVASGQAARYARGVYPEIVHVSHQRWLEQLKRVSENHG